jgi:hypothetical protein
MDQPILDLVVSSAYIRYCCSICMDSHNELSEELTPEEAKSLELDEQPKPTRKVTSSSVPISTEPSSKGAKGRRKRVNR